MPSIRNRLGWTCFIALMAVRGYFQKVLRVIGVILTSIALFINTIVGKVLLIALYLSVFVIALAFNVIVIPFVVHLFLASTVRRPAIFVILALLPLQARRTGREFAIKAGRWWGKRHKAIRYTTYGCAGVATVVVLAEAAGLVGVIAFLPLPFFATAYLKHELPVFMIRAMARMGIDKVIFQGGWAILPLKIRYRLMWITFVAARRIIRTRRRTALWIRGKKQPVLAKKVPRLESVT